MTPRASPLTVGRRSLRVGTFLGLGLASLLACGDRAPAGATRPNLLLVTLDTTRADRFALWDGRERVTPRADRLAREGAAFLRAVAPCATTSPSHASMLTGLEPAQHGLYTNFDAVPASIATVPERLRSAGYRTGAFVSVGFLLDRSGLQRGFEVADRPPRRRSAAETTQEALRWLGEAGDGEAPFFVWVHYYDAHAPYPLTPWAQKRLRDYRGPITGEVGVARFGLGAWIGDPEDTRAIVTRYDGMVQRADRSLGALLDGLRAAGLQDDTVVVLAADHGQALGEHDHPGHGMLWHSELHVPLVIWDAREPVPHRVEQLVGLVDLAPTLLDLAGLPVPEDVAGRSLVPALHGEPLVPRSYGVQRWHRPGGERSENRPAFRQALIDAARDRLDPDVYDAGVYAGSLKLLDGESGTVLFDVAADPGELHPIAPAEHREAYDGLRALVQHQRAIAADTAAPPPISEDTREQLRALGYER